jgi:hypothetical protein
MEISAGLDFMASFQTNAAWLVRHMAMRILSTMGVVLDLALYLASLCGSLFILPATEGTLCDGGSLYQRDFFWRAQACRCRNWVQAVMFKMNTPKTLEKYTAKHIDEITDRIIALRVRWLRHVEAELASQQSRPVLDRYELNTEAAE